MDQSHEIEAFFIKNVHVFTGNSFSKLKTVNLCACLINDAGEDTQTTIDGEGGFLIPGLIDAHIHLNTRHELQVMARHGVTTGDRKSVV